MSSFLLFEIEYVLNKVIVFYYVVMVIVIGTSIDNSAGMFVILHLLFIILSFT